MAQTANTIPASTNSNSHSETNYPQYHEQQQKTLVSPKYQQKNMPLVSPNYQQNSIPPVSPAIQKNNNSLLRVPTANEQGIIRARASRMSLKYQENSIPPVSPNYQQNGMPLMSPNNQQYSNHSPLYSATKNELEFIRAIMKLMNEKKNISQQVHDEEQEFYKKHRGWLMVIAILSAGSTYQSGLNPPGSFWQDDDPGPGGHKAGYPIMQNKSHDRYHAFFYSNAITFISSLVIIMLLMNKNFYRNPMRIKVLKITMVLDLCSFMVAFAIGSCPDLPSTIIVFLMIGLVFLYVLLLMYCYPVLQKIVSRARSRMRIRELSSVRPEV